MASRPAGARTYVLSQTRKRYLMLELEQLLALVMIPTDEPLVDAQRDRRPIRLRLQPFYQLCL